MSAPTPRTDAEAVFPSCNDSSDTSHPQGTHVIADFARTLERELAIEQERATHYRDHWQKERAKVRTLHSALEKLYADTIHHHDYVDDALDATEDKP